MNILIVDDHYLLRSLLASELEEMIGSDILTAENGLDALDKITNNQVDVMFLDVSMPIMDGYTTCIAVQQKNAAIKIIIMSQLGQREVYSWFIQHGVSGIVSKGCDVAELASAVVAVRAGHKFFSQDIREKIFDIIMDLQSLAARVDLDDREKKIINLVVKGWSSKEIAAKLNLKTKSIDSYREQIMRKTNTRNTAELVSFSLTRGIIN